MPFATTLKNACLKPVIFVLHAIGGGIQAFGGLFSRSAVYFEGFVEPRADAAIANKPHPAAAEIPLSKRSADISAGSAAGASAAAAAAPSIALDHSKLPTNGKELWDQFKTDPEYLRACVTGISARSVHDPLPTGDAYNKKLTEFIQCIRISALLLDCLDPDSKKNNPPAHLLAMVRRALPEVSRGDHIYDLHSKGNGVGMSCLYWLGVYLAQGGITKSEHDFNRDLFAGGASLDTRARDLKSSVDSTVGGHAFRSATDPAKRTELIIEFLDSSSARDLGFDRRSPVPARLADALKELQKVASVEVVNNVAESIIYLLAYNKQHPEFFASDESVKRLVGFTHYNVAPKPADYLSPDDFRAHLDSAKKDS